HALSSFPTRRSSDLSCVDPAVHNAVGLQVLWAHGPLDHHLFGREADVAHAHCVGEPLLFEVGREQSENFRSELFFHSSSPYHATLPRGARPPQKSDGEAPSPIARGFAATRPDRVEPTLTCWAG